MSRELILSMSVSMDAFVAGPNGEFDWVFRNSAPESRDWLAAQLDTVSLHAMGRASYQAMVDYWPTAEGPFAPAMNTIPKVVFSRSTEFAKPAMEQSRQAVSESRIEESVLDSWLNPTVKGQDLATDINELKSHGEGVIKCLGWSFVCSQLDRSGISGCLPFGCSSRGSRERDVDLQGLDSSSRSHARGP